MVKRSKSGGAGKIIAGFIALLLVAVLVVVWSIGSNGFTNNNPVKWDWWQSESKDNPAEGGDNVTPTDEGILMFKPITTVDSPVALAAETAAGSNTATLTATLEPENAFYYSASWRSSSNALTVTQDEEDQLKATVELTGTLTETAQITCVVESFKTVTATCTVDYLETKSSVIRTKNAEFISTNSKYKNATFMNGEWAFGNTYSFTIDEYTSTKSTVQADIVLTDLIIKFYAGNLSSVEGQINQALKIEETGWMKEPKISYECSDGLTGTITIPTFEEFLGTPAGVSSDAVANAFYNFTKGRKIYSFTLTGEVRVNGVAYATIKNHPAISSFSPESYLKGADGVTILPGGSVFTD